MQLIRHICVFAVVAAIGVTAARAQPSADARAVIERLHARLVEVAAIEPPLGLEQRVAALTDLINETHDLMYMGRITVRRAWRDWDEAQRAAFSEAFARLSVTTYASRFASVGPQTFGLLGSESRDDGMAEVQAVIRRQGGEDVAMRYALELKDDAWRIVNVFADGVSELGLMRSKYSGILDEGSFDDLIAELEAEIADL